MSELHNKHRPTDFDGVLGQDEVVKSIKTVLKKGTCRAFLLTGPSGTGKTTLARIIASKVGCDPANLVEVDAASNSGVESVRSLTENLLYKPLNGSSKFLIVDEAHSLSTQAFQALLKSIEEPPDGVFWALCTTNTLRVPETIRNRCVQYTLKPVDAELILDLLKRVDKAEKLATSDEVLHLISRKCQGSVRHALTALAKCAGLSSRKEAAALVEAAGEEGELIELCRGLVKGLTWEQAMALIEPMKDQDAEGVRRTVVGYLVKVAMGAKSDDKAGRAVELLDAFSDSYPTGSGIAPLIVSLGRAILMG